MNATTTAYAVTFRNVQQRVVTLQVRAANTDAAIYQLGLDRQDVLLITLV